MNEMRTNDMSTTPTTPASSLTEKKCLPCEGGVAPLTDAQVGPLLKGLSGWSREGKQAFTPAAGGW